MKRIFSKLTLVAMFMALLGFVSCKEDINESNLYTFTGNTIEDYLTLYGDRFSDFNYIVKRAGYDKILSAYGTYTCFAPTNEAVQAYIDSLYDDESVKEELPHNGMTARGLEGLTDSLCTDIALFHLLSSKVMGVDLTQNDNHTFPTLLGRDINTDLDAARGLISINADAFITAMDSVCENGVVHEIDHVITRSNRLMFGEMNQHTDLFSIFAQALEMTGLADSLTEQSRPVQPVSNTYNFYVPEKVALGYTIFAETDEALKDLGINNIDDLIKYANDQYSRCALPSTDEDGWYDYYRNHGISVSTGNDYESPYNCLNMFVRYHILKEKVPYSALVIRWNEISKVTVFEYYETMLPYTLLKVSQLGTKRVINRWVTNNTLTDRIGEQASSAIAIVKREGVEIQNDNISAMNGYIHPIKSLLVYDKNVPRGVLNERLRFDDAALFGEMQSNSFRIYTDTQIKDLNGGKTGSDGALGGAYIRIPDGIFTNLKIYNGENTRLYYLPGKENNWSNYQADEFNCMGTFDFAFRLPPVPDGTYELRMGYTANGNRGMLQFYLGRSSALTSMEALDIPLDMRYVPVDDAAGAPDVRTGWCLYTKTDDQGVESDANMRNLGYMRGPFFYTVGKGTSAYARANAQDLRRIIKKLQLEQGEYWLRFKSVLGDKGLNSQFHLDYIELVPENVYNNTMYVEDMY